MNKRIFSQGMSHPKERKLPERFKGFIKEIEFFESGAIKRVVFFDNIPEMDRSRIIKEIRLWVSGG